LSSSYLTLNAVSLPSKKKKITTVNVLLLILPHFCAYLSLQTLQFLLTWAQEYFLPQGAGYPNYATATYTTV